MTTRGERFKAKVLEKYDLGLAETVLLDEIAATLDVLDDVTLGDTAKRQNRVVLSRLLAQIALADESGQPTMLTGTAMRAQRASQERWRREKR